MLKLTEAELAEMGFRKGWDDWYRLELDCETGMEHYGKNGEALWCIDAESGLAFFYPQTKEDLLTLMRLFTPPQEAKDAG